MGLPKEEIRQVAYNYISEWIRKSDNVTTQPYGHELEYTKECGAVYCKCGVFTHLIKAFVLNQFSGALDIVTDDCELIDINQLEESELAQLLRDIEKNRKC